MPRYTVPIPVLSPKEEARFWSYVKKQEGDGCWEWTAGKGTNGYGRYQIRGSVFFSHRISFFLSGGSFSEENPECLHFCHNPICVRPDHLHAGNHQLNMLEKVEAGRQYRPIGDLNPQRAHPERTARGDRHWAKTHPEKICKGERNGRAKLTLAQAEEIRQRYAAGGIYQYQLAAEYGVTQGLITKIICKKNWA